MDRKLNTSKTSGKRLTARIAIISLAGSAVVAAALFVANNQPWGYVAPPALSDATLGTGNAVAFTPWFEIGTFRGDLLALPVESSGLVRSLTPHWRAATELDNQHYLTGRRIVTTDGFGTGIPFRIHEVTSDQRKLLDDNPNVAEDLLNYVRGDRSGESAAGKRIRSSVLGDIIHSGPVFVGDPRSGFTFDSYPVFAAANAGRAQRVYVGANDGMLHAFDAADGSEVFAYVPSMVMHNLYKLAAQPYRHQYYVDGFLTVEDAQLGGNWHSVLVGGLGAGGEGYYAIDVTNPLAATEGAASGKILWEFHKGSAGAASLGYSYSRPSIVRLDDSGTWGAVVGNGYLSATGVASLFVLDIETGAILKEITVPDVDDNGLSSPTVIDANGDGIADTAYAGDLNGNVWKFELGPGGPGSWGLAFSGAPLFTTSAGRPITTSPEVGRHPEGGVMVYVGTGQLFSSADSADKTTQAVYGLWDDGAQVSAASLITQRLRSVTHASGEAMRTATNVRPDWSVHKGWMTLTEIVGASPLDQGERVLQDMLLRHDRLAFMTVNPSIGTGDNWFIQLDAMTGGAPDTIIVDVNSDNVLDIADNADGDGNLEVQDVPADRVVGQYQQFGLASRPTLGHRDGSTDAALINHLRAIPPSSVIDADDPGLLGGHFDLDTSSILYAADDGDTDGHVHEWDDKWDRTTIDYLDLPDIGKLFNIDADEFDENRPGIGGGAIFMLTVANTEYSPGGVLEINSASVSVDEYHRLVNRYMAGALVGSEDFPLFKLGDPTAAEAAAGVQKLVSLKLSFDAYAIISGDLIPTKTGCVRSNNIGTEGEYRNGALLVQAVDASYVSGDFVYDEGADEYVAPNSSAIHGTHGHTTAGLLWESSVFWHWDGPCYNEPEWKGEYQSCIASGSGSCLAVEDDQIEKGKKRKKKKKDDVEIVDLGGGSPPVEEGAGEVDPGHNVTSTTIRGGTNTGRLFWKELIPEE